VDTREAINQDIDDFRDPDSSPDEELIHDRTYRVRAYRRSPDQIRLRGMVRDIKPMIMWVETGTGPIEVHHMIVDLIVDYPDMIISEVDVEFATNPHDGCPAIASKYQMLVGLPVTRGYIDKVRKLFGGPRGCTHTTALLLAMGPVATQAMTSMAMYGRQPDDWDRSDRPFNSDHMLNTCHFWSEDGEAIALVRAGKHPGRPRWLEMGSADSPEAPGP
jgi:hypothetical protein